MSDSEIHARIKRQCEQANDISDRFIALADTLPDGAIRELVKLLFDEVRYLGEHLPEWRGSVAPFACSDETYHYCSFSTQHDPGCLAAGGTGELANGYENAKSCAADCGETEEQPWCNCAGFGCSTCELVDKLLGILAAHGETL